MSQKYNFPYSETNVYGHVVRLLSRVAGGPRRGVHLDLGCGFGAMAGPLIAATGVDYVGVDGDLEGLEHLRRAGHETYQIIFGGPENILTQLRGLLAGRPLASVSCIDVLEHVNDPADLLADIRQLVGSEPVPLVISVPNVTHINVAAKTIFGRFETTSTGILDRTHITQFSDLALKTLLRQTGWNIVDSEDVEYFKCDQFFPTGHIGLATGSLLAQFLHGLRRESDHFDIVNQLVRLSLPTAPVPVLEVETAKSCFLSLLIPVRPAMLGRLGDLMLSLSAQTVTDFEVLLLGMDLDRSAHSDVLEMIDMQMAEFKTRCRFVACPVRAARIGMAEALNIGITHSRGTYIAELEVETLPQRSYIATLQALAAGSPGAVLCSGAEFDLMRHFSHCPSPSSCHAWPSSLAHDLNRRYDQTLPSLYNWDFLVRAAVICGTVNGSAVIVTWPERAEFRDIMETQRVISGFDMLNLLLPAASASKISRLVAESEQLSSKAKHLQERDELLLEREDWLKQREAGNEERKKWGEARDAWHREREQLIQIQAAQNAQMKDVYEHHGALLTTNMALNEEREAWQEERKQLIQIQAAQNAQMKDVYERHGALLTTNMALSEEREAWHEERKQLFQIQAAQNAQLEGLYEHREALAATCVSLNDERETWKQARAGWHEEREQFIQIQAAQNAQIKDHHMELVASRDALDAIPKSPLLRWLPRRLRHNVVRKLTKVRG